MSPKYLNNSCTPFIETNITSDVTSCTLGNIPSYAINVTCAEDIVAGLKFAKDNNIRLVVKNTGHDYQGRSSGKGSLSLWTHNLGEMSFLNYTSAGYTGPAVRLGAGVQAYRAYPAVAGRGFRITGGLCPTVGIAGGYVTGGGHGPLMGSYGLAADNSLEFEVVTPDKGYLRASPNQNADLFWALNGGGGSAYAIVLSQITRLHADGPVVGAVLTINKTEDFTYWSLADDWHQFLPSLNSIPGFSCTFSLSADAMQMLITVLDSTAVVIQDALLPFTSKVDSLNVSYSLSITIEPTYYEHFTSIVSNQPYGNFPTNNLAGGRIIPHSVVSTEDLRAELVAAIRNIVSTNISTFTVAGNAANLSVSRTGLSNAVLPAWRTMAYSLIISVYPDPAASSDLLDRINTEIIQAQDVLRTLTPDSGTYMNEATAEPGYWKEDYYGINYPRLLNVKKKYDSNFILYGPAVVGSDYWDIAADGRLCKAT